jgi:hypothetical protein
MQSSLIFMIRLCMQPSIRLGFLCNISQGSNLSKLIEKVNTHIVG